MIVSPDIFLESRPQSRDLDLGFNMAIISLINTLMETKLNAEFPRIFSATSNFRISFSRVETLHYLHAGLQRWLKIALCLYPLKVN